MAKRNTTVQSNVRNDLGTMKPTAITIFMPITRAWRVDAIAQMLGKIDTSGFVVDVLICIDSTEITDHYVRNAFEKWELPHQYRIIHTGKPPANEVRMSARRDHICEMLEFATKEIGDSDYTYMIEDDTEVSASSLQSLMQNMNNLQQAGVKVGFVEGAQVGRHGYRMIGAWRWNDLENPTVIETIPYNTTEILEKIDGGGLYCFITPTHLFKAHKWYHTAECIGLDVTYGIELRKKGYINLIDWTIPAGHVQRDKSMLMPNEKCVVVRYEKQPEGHWLLMNDREGYIS